jgi:hypothetical protein
MKEQKCSLFTNYSKEERSDLFFSTTWCRDRLFSSENKEDIMKVYDTFHSRDELIQWMKERPKGRVKIFEIDGNKEVVVVIPTADFEGRYAKECRQSIFKGLQIIFVESGYPKDPYFNYSYSCNTGIKRALKYNPKWIVVSNDDMFKIDDTSVLLNALRGKDENVLKSVFTHPSKYHSIPVCNGRPRIIVGSLGEFLYLFLTRKINMQIYLFTKKIARRFNAKWFFAPNKDLYRKIFYSETRCYVLTSDFSILSGKWAKELNGEIFDETYLNGVEDWDLSLQICGERKDYDFIDYRIGDLVGGTIGGYVDNRTLRDSANMIYFDSRVNENFSRKVTTKF